MKRKHNNFLEGFTLTEMLVTLSVFMIIMAGATLMLKDIFYTYTQQSAQVDSVDNANIDLSIFTNEIRNAAYGNDGSYPFNQASSSQVIFFSTFRASGTNIDRIRYFVASSTLYKGIIVPSGSPLTYNGTETVTPLLTSLATTTIFSYFDGNFGGMSTPLSQPVNVNNVKFVQLNLLMKDQSTRNSTSTFLVTGGAVMRNLKINLGN